MSPPPTDPAPWGTSGDRDGRDQPADQERRPFELGRRAQRRESAEPPADEPVVPAADEVVAAESDADEAEARVREPADPVATAALVVGSIGILFLGILASIVTFVLAAEAGKRARASGRSAENAYLAVALAFVDGAFWIFMHYRFQLPIWLG